MVKEILYLAFYFPPHAITPSIRALEITKRLKELRYKIFVISGKPNKHFQCNSKLLKEIDSPLIVNKQVNSFTYPFNILEYGLKKLSSRLDFITPSFFFPWIPLSFFKSRKIIKRNNIQLIYCTGPPFFSLLLGYLLKKVFKIPLILEYRDPWSYNPYTIKENSELYKRMYRKIEKTLINSADVIIVVSKPLKDFLINKFPLEVNKDNVYVLPNGLDLNKFLKFIPKTPSKNQIILTFTGKLYLLRDLKPLIQIVSEVNRLRKLEDISLKINIFGEYDYSHYANLIKKYKVSKYFHLKGFVSRHECYKQIEKSTLPLHIGENLNYPTISFKVWEYLSMKKKVVYLGLENSYTAKFLKKNNLGFIIPINDINLGTKKFIQLIEDLNKNKIKTNIKLEQISNYSWDIIVDNLVKIFNKIFDKKDI